jgi:hypothetical protein
MNIAAMTSVMLRIRVPMITILPKDMPVETAVAALGVPTTASGVCIYVILRERLTLIADRSTDRQKSRASGGHLVREPGKGRSQISQTVGWLVVALHAHQAQP